jgi:hypothetical protein
MGAIVWRRSLFLDNTNSISFMTKWHHDPIRRADDRTTRAVSLTEEGRHVPSCLHPTGEPQIFSRVSVKNAQASE